MRLPDSPTTRGRNTERIADHVRRSVPRPKIDLASLDHRGVGSSPLVLRRKTTTARRHQNEGFRLSASLAVIGESPCKAIMFMIMHRLWGKQEKIDDRSRMPSR